MLEIETTTICDRCRRRNIVQQKQGRNALEAPPAPEGWSSVSLYQSGQPASKHAELCPGCLASFEVFLAGKATPAAEAP